VVAVARNQTIPATGGTSRADILAAQAPDDAWKRRSCPACQGELSPLVHSKPA
jgi:hypothetical protein